MNLQLLTPFKSLNKAYLKEKLSRAAVELFKQQLMILFEKSAAAGSEDTLKDYVTDFLKNTWYSPDHLITVNKERKDFSIHTGKAIKDAVGVIAEVKRIGSGEIMTAAKPNVKALHELVLYYLHERITLGNNAIKYLLATDINHWFLIDANEFDKKIFSNTKIKKLYEVYVNDKKDNPFFYSEVKKILEETADTIECTHFNLNDYKKFISNADKADDNKLLALYKILSPVHLLKLPFANDSNSLDKNFYAELLHIIGLEEVKDGGKKVIRRKEKSSEASLLENAIIKLQDKDSLRDVPDLSRYGHTSEEQYYNIALELCITWINRILFLKLLEAQLYTYHQNDKAYLFLSDAFIADFDELNNLFLQVLAEKPERRRAHIKEKFKNVPYLNSSLFERTELERKTIDISALDNSLPLPLISSTVLKDGNSKRRQGSMTTLSYLFTFLDSYDFTSEGKAEIQEENKALINASVLGLIFEKINGYKDGSFFTPGFITMYMCRETLRRAVVQKFNERYGEKVTPADLTPDSSPRERGEPSAHNEILGLFAKDFDELKDKIEFQDKAKRREANEIINSLTICDPAVGSGHFLVSALNELISIKHDLNILQYRGSGSRIREYSIEVVNDELIILDKETEELFEYTLSQKGNGKPELQALQETLFHEKETLIENCLFGVDINPNSVKICRLRLWIELLKNAYYTKVSNYTELETLPNIDINIKQGNSLISRFALDADLAPTLAKSKWTIESYKAAVQTYRSAQTKEEKREMETLIDTIKKDFKTDVATYDPINKKLNKLRGDLAKLQTPDLFSADAKKKKSANTELEKLTKQIAAAEKEKDETKNNAIYKDAFEWRFEFPEVLDKDGIFVGFDVLIGNPPYVLVQNFKDESLFAFYKSAFSTATYKVDTYPLFYERAFALLGRDGSLCFISPNTFLKNKFSRPLRELILTKHTLHELLNFFINVFDDASVDTLILSAVKGVPEENFVRLKMFVQKDEILDRLPITLKAQKSFWSSDFAIEFQTSTQTESLISKIVRKSIPLGSVAGTYFGIQTIDRRTNVSSQRENQNFLPVIDGTNIHRYSLKPSVEFVNYKAEAIKSGGDRKIYQKQRIAVRQIGKFPEGVIIPEMLLTLNTIYNIYSKDQSYDLRYLLGIINSKLVSFFWVIKFYDNKATFPKIKKLPLEEIPILKLLPAEQQPIIHIVEDILQAKNNGMTADVNFLENKINNLLYEMYSLTMEEKNLVEASI